MWHLQRFICDIPGGFFFDWRRAALEAIIQRVFRAWIPGFFGGHFGILKGDRQVSDVVPRGRRCTVQYYTYYKWQARIFTEPTPWQIVN